MDVDPSEQVTYSTDPRTKPFADAVESVEGAAIRHHLLQRRLYELQVEHRALEEEYEKMRETLHHQQTTARVDEQSVRDDSSSGQTYHPVDTFTISGAERRLIEVIRRLEHPAVMQGISVWECMSYSDGE